MRAIQYLTIGIGLFFHGRAAAAELGITDDNPLLMPRPGAYQLRVLSPTVLELTLITTKPPDPARVEQWDFVTDGEKPRLPAAEQFLVVAAGQKVPVRTVGFKRRV